MITNGGNVLIDEITLGNIHKEIRAGGVGSKAPDLTGLGHIVLVLVRQIATTNFEVVTCVDFSFVNIFSQTVRHGDSLHVKTIVLVGGLGQTDLVGFF